MTSNNPLLFQIFRLGGVDLAGLHEGLTANDFGKLAQLKNAITTSEDDVTADAFDDEDDNALSSTRQITAATLFVDECNNDSGVAAFSGAKLGLLLNGKVVDVADLANVGVAPKPEDEVRILRAPKVVFERCFMEGLYSQYCSHQRWMVLINY